MSDGIKRMHEDIDDYITLCRKYNEAVQYDGIYPDCYGKHSTKLEHWDKYGLPRDFERLPYQG